MQSEPIELSGWTLLTTGLLDLRNLLLALKCLIERVPGRNQIYDHVTQTALLVLENGIFSDQNPFRS